MPRSISPIVLLLTFIISASLNCERFLRFLSAMIVCFLGMQSLVTKDFLGSNSIIAGNPAKVIKKDIVWKREAPENVIEM